MDIAAILNLEDEKFLRNVKFVKEQAIYYATRQYSSKIKTAAILIQKGPPCSYGNGL
jgi:hypothetical protein